MKLGDIRAKIGPLWWYTLVLFLVQRLGDLLNAVSGVWLIPRYVPMEELGALKPLTQIGALLGLPLGLLLTPFIKLLNTHAARGEHGKVKAMLRDAAIFVAVASPLSIVAARLFMPSVFALTRIGNGRLAAFVVFSGIVGAITPIFSEALRGLKRFRSGAVIGMLTAPARFLVLLVALPVRGITGFFAGQSAGPLLSIILAIADLARTFGRKIRCEAYWREDRGVFLAYLVPLGVLTAAGNIGGTMEMLLLPSIPKVESAAFYHLSIFAEMTNYLLTPMVFVLFPLIAERHEMGIGTRRTLIQTMVVSLATGAVVAAALYALGGRIFSLADATLFGRKPFGFAEVWRPYIPYTRHFGIMAMTIGVRMAMGCFTAHELACRRFRFVGYCAPLALLEALLIRLAYRHPAISGYGSWHLGDVLAVFFVFALLPLIGGIIDLALALRTERRNKLARARA